MSNENLIHFDELEGELESVMREMVTDFGKRDPSVVVQTGDAEELAYDFSKPYAEKFLAHLTQLGISLRPDLQESIRNEFVAVISEYDTVDTVVAAKVDDQVPELGIQALLSEHKQPIMQLLQELDEGIGKAGGLYGDRIEKRYVP